MRSKNKDENTSKYKDLLRDTRGGSSPFSGLLVIILLFSTLTGLFGYYLGDRGSISNIFSSINKTQGQDAKVYSASELEQIIDSKNYDFQLYNQIIANLKDKYVDSDKVKDKELFEGSLKGMVDALGDRATNYFSAKEYKEYLESFSGSFEGIGVRLEYQNAQVVVMDVLQNSPAIEQGVQAGYVFYKVDGTDVNQSSIEDIVSKVRCASGTKVKITFIDPVKKEEVEKEITRAAIKVESMRLVEKNPDTVVFEVTRFTEGSLDEWKKIWDTKVSEINSKGYKNVVLDLRGNGGGYLDAAVHAANDFLDKDKLIVSEKSKVNGDRETKSKGSNPRLKNKKVVVLINNGTASASEILAGAIKFHNNYKVLGTKTFGKGTVQNTFNLPDGGALKITTEYWLLPTGKRLDNENPIKPDVEIKADLNLQREGKDNVMEEALKQF